MLTPASIAKRLIVDDDTVRVWIATKQLRAVNVAKSATAKKPRWRITEADLQTFLDRRANGSAAAPASSPPRSPRARTRDVIPFF